MRGVGDNRALVDVTGLRLRLQSHRISQSIIEERGIAYLAGSAFVAEYEGVTSLQLVNSVTALYDSNTVSRVTGASDLSETTGLSLGSDSSSLEDLERIKNQSKNKGKTK